ncbi:hypothetical protein BGZ54_002456 [Gamsiella multidivaricata]|nr:hypothetical protein BGZ54_002456 [Gamsiella multidivaricata]
MDPWAHSSPVPAEYCSDNNSDPTDNTTLASQIIPAAEIRGHHQTINSALHQRSGYHLPPHLNLRRAQSMDAFVTQVPSFSLSPEVMISCNSSPGSPMTMLVSPHQNGSQRGHQHHGSYGGYFPASAGSSSPTLKDVSTDVNMSLEANVETIPICKVRSLTEGPEMTEYHHHHYQNQQQLHQAHIPLSAPFDQRIHINSLPGMPCSTNDDIFSTRSSYSDNRQGEIYPDDTGNNRDNDNNKKPKARPVVHMAVHNVQRRSRESMIEIDM